jgi:SP family general alpha glucoside:H+ symporter-like MFS transporter
MAAATTRTEHELADKFEMKELAGAARADEQERTATVMSAFRTHKKAVFWSMALSAA